MDRRHNLPDLLVEYGGERFLTVANGLDPRENAWARYCFKIATGGGSLEPLAAHSRTSRPGFFWEANAARASMAPTTARNKTCFRNHYMACAGTKIRRGRHQTAAERCINRLRSTTV